MPNVQNLIKAMTPATVATLLAASALLAPAMARAEEGLPEKAGPSVCVVLIGLALEADVIPADEVAAYTEAQTTFHEKADAIYGGKGSADQMIGSSVNLYVNLSNDDKRAGAEMCMDAVDQEFTED